jgi:hypothetical protein
MARPARAIVMSSPLTPCSTASWTAFVAARTPSPSRMIVNRPYRSAMWCGCQVVMPGRSAMSGTERSQAARTKNSQVGPPSGRASRDTQNTWTIERPAA